MAVRIYPGLESLLVPIETLRQHPQNANNADMDTLRESILLNGFYAPIIVDADGFILAGNHRYQVMTELGASHIPAVTVDPDTITGKRILLVDNESTRRGWDDPAQRLELLREIADAELPTGIAGTGFTEEDWLNMLREAEEPLHFGSSTKTYLTVVCPDPDSARDLAHELRERGYDIEGAPL